ncbi:hypothetical protein GCM10008013_00490 [Paenibacillus segetis]|uniref:MmyB-like transcription regulator ligand binding domain-containing protein n=2 Tax=Paenibacillus segetis TaxID=1325360 RepID=A0ABQ1Y2B7_9BACL|nr:hypothetical protein GCM10008013_00490 [Paenibacillus segetis]
METFHQRKILGGFMKTRRSNLNQIIKVVLSFYRTPYDRSADQSWYIKLIGELTEQSKEFRELWQQSTMSTARI